MRRVFGITFSGSKRMCCFELEYQTPEHGEFVVNPCTTGIQSPRVNDVAFPDVGTGG